MTRFSHYAQYFLLNLTIELLRDKNGHTPYMVSKDKATRNEFRRYMGKWPEKYDYAAAQVLNKTH